MFINNCYTNISDLITLNKSDTVDRAIETLQKHKLKSIPVIDDEKKFVGILSKEHLFELFENGFTGTFENLKKIQIQEAILEIKPLSLENRFEETLPIIVRYPFVPIVDEEKRLLGIVKRKEITKVLESSFGVGVSGIRLLIGTPEMEGRLEKILEIAHHLHLNVITAVAFDAGEKFNRRILLKIQHTSKKENLLHRLDKNGFTILTIHED